MAAAAGGLDLSRQLILKISISKADKDFGGYLDFKYPSQLLVKTVW